jgi:RNA polymerase sigma factor (sigma-70 family)
VIDKSHLFYFMIPNQSIEALWETYYPKVYGYFYRRISSVQDVEDLTSIVLTQFIRSLKDNTKTIANPNGFLWKTAYFHLVDFIKSKSKKPISIPFEDDFEANDDLENRIEAQVLNEKLEKILLYAQSNLTTDEYTIFSRSYLDGDRIMDIAHDLDLKANTVTVKLKRIIQKLKSQTQNI